MGLHISKELVELMSGSIWVEKSEIGKGSTFAFVIPMIPCGLDLKGPLQTLQLSSTEHENLPNSSMDDISRQLPRLRVLVVEDNTINQRVILKLLSKFQFCTKVVNDGQEALDILEKEPFDLILMDVQMPVMDGLTAARRINEKYGSQRPKIAALTANVMKQEMAACIQAGMDYYISKPITANKILSFFESILKNEIASPTPLPSLEPPLIKPAEDKGLPSPNSTPTRWPSSQPRPLPN